MSVLFVLIILLSQSPAPPVDHPWTELLNASGTTPLTSLWLYPLWEDRGDLPPGDLEKGLDRLSRKTRSPLVRGLVRGMLAELYRERGAGPEARALVRELGFLTTWEVLLPERLQGTVVAGDPFTGMVDIQEFMDLSSQERILLRTRLEFSGNGAVLALIQGQGVEYLDPGQANLPVPEPPGFLRDGAGLCLQVPAGETSLLLGLASDRGEGRFSLRLAAPDGADLGRDGMRLIPGSGTCTLPIPALMEQALDRGEQIQPRQRLAAAWILWKNMRTQLSDQFQDLIADPGDWLEMDLLARLLEDDFYQWERLCRERPWCSSSPLRQVLEAEKLLARGQVYLARKAAWTALDGIQSLDRGKNPPSLSWRLRLAAVASDIYQTAALPAVGADLVKRLTLEGSKAPSFIEVTSSAMVAAARISEAISLLREFCREQPGNYRFAVLLANLLGQPDQLPEQQQVWESLLQLHPVDSHVRLELAQNLARQGKTQAAVDLLREASLEFSGNPRIWENLGERCLDAGDREAAAEAWRRASELEPHNQLLAARLQQLSGEEDLWSGVRRSQDWIREQAGQPELPDGLRGLSDIWMIQLHQNGLSTLFRQRIIRVGKGEGPGELILSLPYDPHTEDVTTLSASIYQGGGKLTRGAEEDDRSLTGEEYNIYYDVRRLERIFEHLAPGDVVVWEYRVDQFRGTRGGFSMTGYLQDAFPKDELRIITVTPEEQELHYKIQRWDEGPEPEMVKLKSGQDLVTRWTLNNLPALRVEDFPPPLSERGAFFVLSTMFSWNQVTEWYRGLLERQSLTTPEMESFARDLGTLEGIAAFVADSVRYVGLEFGVNAYVPYPSSQVFKRRFGDCKDKSLLMIRLLATLGITAELVVLRTFPMGMVEDPPPSISLFDHAIVFLPDQEIWFDPTARFMGLGSPPWQDQGAQALVLCRAGGRSVTLPVDPASANRTSTTIELQRDRDQIRIQGRLALTGARARENFDAAQSPGEWNQRVERYMTTLIPGFTLESTSWGVDQSTQTGTWPMWVEVEGSATRDPQARGIDLMRGKGYVQALARTPERTRDMVLPYPFEEELILRWGPGLGVKLPGRDRMELGCCAWSIRETPDAPGELRLLLELPSRRIPPEEYKNLRECLRALDDAMAELEVRLED